jgi:hypothetical protein
MNCMKLPQITKILQQAGGLREGFSLRIENKPWMALHIEELTAVRGPNGRPVISVAHYFEQNGDMCKDPQMTFEVYIANDGQKTHYYTPLTFEQSLPPLYQQVFGDDFKTYKPQLLRELKSFAHMWQVNIGHQGFLKALKAKGQEVESNG